MSLMPVLIALYAFAAIAALAALSHGVRMSRHWRARRRFAASYRALWCVIFLLLALLGAFAATALLGYRRLAAEANVARLTTHTLDDWRHAVTIDLPDGSRREVILTGDDWQLDARVIKWDLRAVALGAPPLYQLDRISGRYRNTETERGSPKSVVALDNPKTALDLWTLKRQFPRWLPWIDADYGSAAYLPFIDDGHFSVTLAAGGGLVARPADAATAAKIEESGW